MVLSIVVSFLIFTGSFNSHMHRDIENRLQESMEPNMVSFELQMEEQIKKVKTFAEFLGENWDLEDEVHSSLLRSAVKNNGLLRCAIAYPDGSFITHDSKNEGTVITDDFFLANMNGDFFITDPRPSVVDQAKTVILFSAPIMDQNSQILGSVIYSYLCDDMNKIFNLTSMSESMNMVVTKASGDVLIGIPLHGSVGENLVEQIQKSCTHQSHDSNTCISLLGENGITVVTINGEAIYVRYNKLRFNDWYMVATIPEVAATKSIAFAAKNQRHLSMLLAGIVTVYISVIFVIWLTQRKMIDKETGAFTIHAFKKKSKEIFKNRTDDDYVVVKLDVKDFKLINRIYSFSMGDKVIKSVTQALEAVLTDQQSTFARVGIDIFVILLPYKGAEVLYEKRQEFINQFRVLMKDGFSAKINFPTGQYVLKPSDFPKPDIEEILEKVNFAHRAAKQRLDVIIDYEDDIETAALFEKRIEDRMESAIQHEEFTLYLQPKIRLCNEMVCGAEALVRWKVGGKYYMYPTDFVPILERNGFIVQVDKHMFHCAAKFIRDLLDRGIEPIPISVNFSRHHLNNENLVDELCQIADSYQIPCKYLEIELTESAFLGNVEDIVLFIERLHQKGFLISMDDFGSGYSCFAQMKDLKIDIIKIDKGFFDDGEDDERARVVIAGIIKMAQELHITTVAEGVEKREQIDMLKSLGCDIVQGYYYARPMPATDLDIENFFVNSEGLVSP